MITKPAPKARKKSLDGGRSPGGASREPPRAPPRDRAHRGPAPRASHAGRLQAGFSRQGTQKPDPMGSWRPLATESSQEPKAWHDLREKAEQAQGRVGKGHQSDQGEEVQDGENRASVCHAGNQKQGPPQQGEANPHQDHPPDRCHQSKSVASLAGMGRDPCRFPGEMKAVAMHSGRSSTDGKRHRPHDVVPAPRSFGQESRIWGGAARHSGWDERKRARTPISGRERRSRG